MTDCRERVSRKLVQAARSWRPDGATAALNFFGVDASQPLSVWRDKGWIHPDDPRGWFQWYCRYYLGRRMPDDDAPDRALEGDASPYPPGQEALRAGRPRLPAAASVSAAALGL